MKNCSCRDYFFHLNRIIVAPRLLGILHLCTQVALVLGALVFVWRRVQEGVWHWILAVIVALIGIPLASCVIRFGFELLMLLFAISKNVAKIKRELFEDECSGCCGGHDFAAFEMEELVTEPAPIKVTPLKKAPIKKPVERKSTVKKSVEKKPIAKKSVSKKK